MAPQYPRGGANVTMSLVFSYVLDWIIIVGIAAVGAGLSQISPRKRPFDLTDRSISYPLVADTITNSTLFLTTLIAPAAIITISSAFISLRGTSSPHRGMRRASLRRKLWEWNVGWMGLALSYAITFAIANGAKQVLGKPRPNLLARCSPDLSKRLGAMAGGIGEVLEEGITMYDFKICRNGGDTLEEGFRSFPSGHSSLAFAGLGYLALWLCAKLGVAIPTYPLPSQNTAPQSSSSIATAPFLSSPTPQSPLHRHRNAAPLRTSAAAPPTYLIIFPLIPLAAAIYISSTRFSDFMHHGFDVLISAFLGLLVAWFAFRWYHMPIQTGGGWAWAPRSARRAWGKSVGKWGYGQEGQSGGVKEDPEQGRILNRRSTTAPEEQRRDDEGSSGRSWEMGPIAPSTTNATALQAPGEAVAAETAQRRTVGR